MRCYEYIETCSWNKIEKNNLNRIKSFVIPPIYFLMMTKGEQLHQYDAEQNQFFGSLEKSIKRLLIPTGPNF